MICPHCHTENRDGAKFCDECGTRLSPQKASLPEDHRAPRLADLPAIGASAFGMADVQAVVEVEGGVGDSVEADVQDGSSAPDVAAELALELSDAPGEEPGEAEGQDQPADDGAELSADDVAADPAMPGDDAIDAQADEESAVLDDQAEGEGCDDDRHDEDEHGGDEPSDDEESSGKEPGELSAEVTGRIDLAVLGSASSEPSSAQGNVSAERTQALDLSQIGRLEFEAGKTQNLGPRPASPALQSSSGADLSGFDEFLVYPGYMPPKGAWHSGDTMEMPRITEADMARRTEFIAPDADKKRRRKKDKRAKKAEAAAVSADASRDRSDAAAISGKLEGSSDKASGHASKGEARSVSAPRAGGRAKKVAAVVAIVVALAAGGAALATYQMELWGGKIVPDVTGMTQADATYLLQNKGFTVSATTVPSDSTEGMVLLMDPGAGARQDEGSEVVIHVSTSRTVPAVVGSSQDAALKALSDSGFENVSVDTVLSDEAEGQVLSIDPGEGEKAKASTPITVTVAQPYTVPDVSGMTPREAAAAIDEAGLSSTSVYAYDESVSEGSLLGVEPASGSKVTSDTVVVITIAKSRASELVAAARSYLASNTLKASDGSTFTVSSVDSVAYQGNNTVTFTASGRASTSVTVLGQTLSVSGDSKQVTGSMTFDSSNNVATVSFN